MKNDPVIIERNKTNPIINNHVFKIIVINNNINCNIQLNSVPTEV